MLCDTAVYVLVCGRPQKYTWSAVWRNVFYFYVILCNLQLLTQGFPITTSISDSCLMAFEDFFLNKVRDV